MGRGEFQVSSFKFPVIEAEKRKVSSFRFEVSSYWSERKGKFHVSSFKFPVIGAEKRKVSSFQFEVSSYWSEGGS